MAHFLQKRKEKENERLKIVASKREDIKHKECKIWKLIFSLTKFQDKQ